MYKDPIDESPFRNRQHHFCLQLDSRSEHLENISRLQLYEYQLDENLCPNAPPALAPSAMSDSFNHHTNESPGYATDRSTCFDYHDVDDTSVIRVGTTSERSKDNLRSVRSKDSSRSGSTSRSADTLGSKDTSSGGSIGNSYRHTTKMMEVNELGEATAAARRQIGLLAQEVQTVLPNAVRVTVSFMREYMCVYTRNQSLFYFTTQDSTVHLSDGTSVSNLLVVDKVLLLFDGYQ